jgi:dipeptidyl aminopeptidase/acylaminoacyl peptidase
VPEGERPPLVVMAHGGPTGMTSDSLSLRIQWWTNRGIGVVDVNYGGSSGFGRVYRRRLDRQWGVVDVDDCIAAARHLVETGRADPARIAIRGGSAGGFTVLAALTRSTVFSAAACLYGIGELRSLAADTHKFESRYLDRLIGRLPEDGATYDARSPIHHLDALRCPVIFFHGVDDKVVPVAQSRLMAQALRDRGIRVSLHEFEGEAHGFRREETIRQVLDLELAFYGSLFGFTPSVSSTRPAA